MKLATNKKKIFSHQLQAYSLLLFQLKGICYFPKGMLL